MSLYYLNSQQLDAIFNIYTTISGTENQGETGWSRHTRKMALKTVRVCCMCMCTTTRNSAVSRVSAQLIHHWPWLVAVKVICWEKLASLYRKMYQTPASRNWMNAELTIDVYITTALSIHSLSVCYTTYFTPSFVSQSIFTYCTLAWSRRFTGSSLPSRQVVTGGSCTSPKNIQHHCRFLVKN